MKETHTEDVHFSDKYLYADLEYPPKFQVPDFKNMMGLTICRPTFICME